MAINVVVSGDSDPISLNVTGGVGPGAPPSVDFIVGGHGITVTTSSGQVVVSGPLTATLAGYAPVQQVQGRTGNVVIVAGDITSGTFDVARIPVLPSENQVVSSGDLTALTSGQQSDIVKGSIVTTTDGRRWVYSGAGGKTATASYVELADITPEWSVIANKPTTFLPSAHTHSTTDIVLFSESASVAAPVQKVAGRTGEVTITTTDVVGLTASIQQFANVKSVQGRTGDVVLTLQDITAAAVSHTHAVADIVDVTTVANVVSVNGKTGFVSLTVADISDLTAVASVVSVNGHTGVVSLVVDDLTAAAAVHSHVAADVSDLTTVANVVSVNGKTGTVSLIVDDITAAASVHGHLAADVSDLTSVANVVSVNGKTGTVSLVASDLTAAASVHGHLAADVSDLTTVANVVSVNGITGAPSIVAGDNVTVTTSASSITIAAPSPGNALPSQGGSGTRVLSTDGTAASWVSRYSIVDDVVVAGLGISFTKDTNAGSITFEAAGGTSGVTVGAATPQPLGVAAAGSSGNASREDHVHAMPTAAQVGAASASHSHVAADVSDLTTIANVVSVNGKTGVVSLLAGDLTAAAAVHSHVAADVSDLTSVANVVSVNGQTGVVTVTGGVTAASVTTKSLSTDQNNYDAGSSDIVRLTPSADVTLTGLAGGSDGVVRVLYNVNTHVVTLSSGNTNSVATNRFSIVSGNVTLDEGDSASAWYDGTSQRWRVLEDQITGGSGGSGGGIAMSYLFG